MTVEVVVAQIPGSLTTRDLRGVEQDVLSIEVVVLATEGTPFIGRVQLGEIPGGPGAHRGLMCGRCRVAKYKLFVFEAGELACMGCGGLRSRRQNQRTSRTWLHLGGKEEDFVLRALRPGRRNNLVSERVERTASDLVAGDRARWGELRVRVGAALMVATAGDVALDDALEEQ